MNIKRYKRCLWALMLLSWSTTNITAQQLPYQNPNLTAEQRAEDLLGRLTLEEKTLLMMNSSPAIPRLGIPSFDWWSEALHGVGRNGIATVFPQCIGMACSFDVPLLERIYTAVSDEARAKNNIARKSGKVKRYQGLSFWTPNINIFRDPRWGRGQETYGEDPYMNSVMGLAVVRGLQGTTRLSPLTTHHYYKLHACAKHFAVHSGPEKTRHHFNIENLSPRDLWETYLPAFKTLVQEGNVQQVMCAYQRFEGEPCCGSDRLLQQILRKEWGYQGLVVSDCGAIRDFLPQWHGVSKDSAAAVSKAIISGTDVECGSLYKSLPEAVRRGDISEEQVNVSVRRLLKGRIELGDLDPDSIVEWTKIPSSVIASKEHQQLALQMAREQMVLLKNNGVLPLNAHHAPHNSKIMVMGPNAADSTMLWGIYFGKPAHTVTVLEGIERKIGKVRYEQACDITDMTVRLQAISGTSESRDGSTTLELKETSRHTNTMADVLKAAQEAETVIFVGGISPNLEREEAKKSALGFDKGDRTTIELPQVQRDILKALHDAGKKVILVCCSGSAIGLKPEQQETCDAILQAWYAGEQGGHAVADVLFGDYNPSGKLAVTFYKDDSQLPAFDDYSMKNRTYRYFQGEPLYPFGYGLSYTTFQIKDESLKMKSDGSCTVTVKVKNSGKREGTEIVQVYIRNTADKEGPLKTLKGFERVTLKAGECKTVAIDLPRQRFEGWDTATNTMRVVPGTYEVMVGTSSADKDLKKMKVKVK